MKKTLYILMGAALVLASCEKVQEVKSLEIERTSGIHQAEAWSEFIQGTGTVNTIGDEAYYQNLRDWKKAAFDADGITTRSISYIFFADYGSMAFRFADIPDSVDVINLWGGCPKKGSLDYQEMKACQEIKGMKVVGCRITRILENARWGMEAQIPSFMKAYEAYKYDNMGKILQGKMTAQELESAALEAGNAALRADVQAHPGKGANSREAEGGPEWPEWCVYASQVLLDEIEQYGLDGYDLDYEPEGDPLSGTAFNTMVAYLSQFIGPKSGNEGTLLIIDRNSGAGDKDLAKLCTSGSTRNTVPPAARAPLPRATSAATSTVRTAGSLRRSSSPRTWATPIPRAATTSSRWRTSSLPPAASSMATRAASPPSTASATGVWRPRAPRRARRCATSTTSWASAPSPRSNTINKPSYEKDHHSA